MKIFTNKFSFLFALNFILIFSYSQDQIELRNDFRVMFYNLENFFDVYNDPKVKDEEFLLDGNYRWSKKKFETKLHNITKVITAVGEWQSCEIMAFCELENVTILKNIIDELKLEDYKIIHKESPDVRGIDVGLIYNSSFFSVLEKKFINIDIPDNDRSTRDILYVKGKLNNGKVLHLFVNHWPSRWGGEAISEPYRLYVASILKLEVSKIFHEKKEANIIVCGDFNDYYDNKSISEVLNVQYERGERFKKTKLYNLTILNKKLLGSHKYKGVWGFLDQIIVSGNLLNSKSKTFTTVNKCKVFTNDFILENDNKYGGNKPFRTFVGFKYNGGYSDHLPIYLDIVVSD